MFTRNCRFSTATFTNSFQPKDTGDSESILRFLRELHRDWHQPIPRLLERSLQTGVQVLVETFPAYVAPTESYYVSDGAAAVLIGDARAAVTPNLAQGAAVAIEDACALAVCLKKGIADNSASGSIDTGIYNNLTCCDLSAGGLAKLFATLH